MKHNGFSLTNNEYTFAQDISLATALQLKERSRELPGVDIAEEDIRSYPDGTTAPHLVGTVGSMSAEEWETYRDEGYQMSDFVGKFGIEPMGAVGAGVATFVARCCMCAMIGGYVLLSPRFKSFIHDFDRAAIRLRTMWEILKVGIPIAFHMFMEASAFVVTNILVLSFGAHAISAYQICTNMMQVTFMIVVAIGSANTILCSHIFGRGDFDRLRRTVYSAYHLGLVWCITAAVCFVAFRYTIPALFSSNLQVIELTGTLLIFISLFQIPDCLQTLSISALRGLQDVRVIMPIVFVSYVLINIPAGYLLAFPAGMGAEGLILGLIAGLTCCAVLTIRRLRRDMVSLEKRIASSSTKTI